MKIILFYFNGITALDAIGPYEVLKFIPDARIFTVAKEKGEITTDKGLKFLAEKSIHEFSSADILIIPGGIGSRTLMKDELILNWIKHIHKTTQFTLSVCTGALILAAAGLLKDVPATTHWASLDKLAKFGAIPTSNRIVKHDKIITCAGVSAGIDMALHFVNEQFGSELAQMIQLGLEYDPKPPFNAGSVKGAPSHIVDKMKIFFKHREEKLKTD